ncbi:MAG TPA: hypothetical protein VFP84_30880 [Kofleriaceae bacterium]|nr:hypothetical protein [Kofleriaceae bacterium]
MSISLRPSFAIDLEMPAREALPRLAATLADGPMALRRTRLPGGGRDDARPRARDHLVLTVPEPQRHFWSPWLTIEVTPRGARTHLMSRFSPHPSVWTAFAFGYLALTCITAVSLAIAGAGLLVPGSDQGWSLWVAAGGVLCMAALWWVSRIGQRIARAQMATLTAELERVIDVIGARPVA